MPEGKILIVEDDVEFAVYLQGLFEAEGYEVKTTPLGQEALEIARKWLPEVIIQDIRLPDISGYEVVRRLQEGMRTKQIGVVFLTELGNRTDRLRGLQLGAVDYITKPCDFKELSLKVKNAIKALHRPQPYDPVTRLLRRNVLASEVLDLVRCGEWAALRVLIQGVEEFRDFYGFVAGDDLLRAVALVISNALDSCCQGRYVTGLLREGDFLLLVPAEEMDAVETLLKERLIRTVGFFFPSEELAAYPADRGPLPIIEIKMGRALIREELRNSLEQIVKATEPLETIAVVKGGPGL